MPNPNERKCKLHTLEGVKEGHAVPYENGSILIEADDLSFAFVVSIQVFNRKFEQEDCPTFYAC